MRKAGLAARRIVLAVAAMLMARPAAGQVRMAEIAVHPALWTVHAAHATAYLLGSIHLLPANIDWHTPAIDRALASADIFVFEAPLGVTGEAEVAEFIRQHGALPKGTSLPALLPKRVRADYQRALAEIHIAPATLNHEQPWLADLVLGVAYLQQLHYVVSDGVDREIFRYATARGKTVRCFETPQQQLKLLMPSDQKLEIAEFDADLKGLRSQADSIGAIVDAWSAGDVKAAGRLINKDFEGIPGARKALIDDRDRAWVKQLDHMLAQGGTYFVTVGAGHLVGPEGVPAQLRAQGYRVDGP